MKVEATPAGQQLSEFVNRQSVKLDKKYAFVGINSATESSSSVSSSS